MDELAQVHEEYIKNITKLCFLDKRNQEVLKMLLAILQITLDFRRLCQHYLSGPSIRDDASSSSEGEGLVAGGGLLEVESLQFVERYNKCRAELDRLVASHRQKMQVLTKQLEKHSKKGIFNYMNEALLRFNFNEYYVKD